MVKIISKIDIVLTLQLILFSAPVFKFGPLRINQISLLFVFFIALFSYKSKISQSTVIQALCLIWAGIIISILSKYSGYEKIKESSFAIKYIFLYPVAFYTGSELFRNISSEKIVCSIRYSILVIIMLAVLIEVLHPSFIPSRAGVTGIKGMGTEQGDFTYYLGALLTFLILWPAPLTRSDQVITICSSIILYLTNNKSIWISALVVYFTYKAKALGSVKLMIVLIFIFSVGAYYDFDIDTAVRDYLSLFLDKYQVDIKMESERGLALKWALKSIYHEPVFGYGFGYVEYFFGHNDTGIIGLGFGVGEIFNSFLNLCVSSGVFGAMYYIMVLTIPKKKSILSYPIIFYILISTQLSPYLSNEYTYFFIGAINGLSKNTSASMINHADSGET